MMGDPKSPDEMEMLDEEEEGEEAEEEEEEEEDVPDDEDEDEEYRPEDEDEADAETPAAEEEAERPKPQRSRKRKQPAAATTTTATRGPKKSTDVAEKPKSGAILKVTSKPYQFETTITLGETQAEFRVKDLASGNIVSTHTKDIPPKEERCRMSFPPSVVPPQDDRKGFAGGGDGSGISTTGIKTEPLEQGMEFEPMRVDKLEPMDLTLDQMDNQELWEELEDKHVHGCCCGMYFKSQPLYYLHRPAHDMDEPRKCGHCGRLAADWSDFQSHLYDCRKTAA